MTARSRWSIPGARHGLWLLLAALVALASPACGSTSPTEQGPPHEEQGPPPEEQDADQEGADQEGADQAAPPLQPADPRLAEQWGLSATRVPDAWGVSSGEGVVIAVVDTGVDLQHPDLAANLVGGIDLVDGDEVPDDPNGHGTHVAGIAAAAANDIGTVGAAPRASIMPVRVLDAQGAGSDETIAQGVLWAADHGADVINLSLGEAGFVARLTKGGALNRALRRVTAEGVVVVAASGNEGEAGQQYRIGVDVIVVNAVDPDGTLTSFSNVADVRAISAPGAGILSTAPAAPTTIWAEGTDGYAPLDGTSMAAPLVSGVAALAIAAGVDGQQVVDLLASTASMPPGGTSALGAGVLDAASALGIAPG